MNNQTSHFSTSMPSTLASRARNEQGFTIIEALVATLIVSILAAIAIPQYLNQRDAVASQQMNMTLTQASVVLTGYTPLYPTHLPTEVIKPEHINLTYRSDTDAREWCIEGSEDGIPGTFTISGSRAGVSKIEPGECEPYENGVPLDSPIVTAELTREHKAVIFWGPVRGAEHYVVENVMTGEQHTVTGTRFDTALLPETTDFRVWAHAQGRMSAQSMVARVEVPIGGPILVTTPVIYVSTYAMGDGTYFFQINWHALTDAQTVEIRNADTEQVLAVVPARDGWWYSEVTETTSIYVVAVNDKGERSRHSNTLTFTITHT